MRAFLIITSVVCALLVYPTYDLYTHQINKEVLVDIKTGMTLNEVIEVIGIDPVDINYEGNLNNFRIHYYDGLDGVVQFNFKKGKMVSFRSY